MTVLFLSVLFSFPQVESLPLNKLISLSSETEIGEDFRCLYESSELVFSVRSVTRRVSILGWASERYDLEVDSVLKGDLEEETVSLFTFPGGLLTSRLSTLHEGCGLVVFAFPDSTDSYMEGFYAAEESWAVQLSISHFN